MPFGQTDKTLDYPKSAEEAFIDAREALDWVGDVRVAEEGGRTVEGVAWYGSQKVKIKVTISPKENGSTIRVIARGDDIWAYAAKNCMGHYLDALANIDNPDFVPNQKKPTEAPPGFLAAFGVMILIGTAILLKARADPWGHRHTFGAALLGVGIPGLVGGLLWWKMKRKPPGPAS